MTPILSATILRTQSDARLLVLAGQGHERAFEAIVERYRRAMLRYCRRFLPEPRAEDAVQQAFLNAWSAIQQGTEVGDLRAWLYRIARNAALDAAKRAGYDYSELTEALELDAAAESEVERRWVIRETLSGVAALPENQREALLRTVVEGQSRAEIARELQITEGAVRQLVHRARAALRAAATAVTPTPVVNWATAFGQEHGDTSVRIAELVAGSGAVGGSVLLKTGTAVVAAGAIAVGAGTGLESPPATDRAVASSSREPGDDDSVGRDGRSTADARSPGRRAPGSGRSAASRAGAGGRADSPNRGPGSLNSGPGSSSSGPGTSGPGSSGSGSSGSESSGSGSGDDNSGPGSTSSGSGSSGSGSSGSGSSGSGSSDSGDDDNDSSGSGSDGDDDDDNSGSGSAGDDDDDSSGSGSAGDDDDDDSSGSGSDGDDD